MANVLVKLKLDTTGKTLLTDRTPIVVEPGDTIEWKCDDGEITVSVEGAGLFEGNAKFSAKKGQSTARGKIAATAAQDKKKGLMKHFDCKVTFDGKPMPISYGFDVPGSGK